MEEDNWSKQADEVEVLSSIYGDEWHVDDPVERQYSIKVIDCAEEPKYSLTLQVVFSDQYPSDAPPSYQLLGAAWLKREDKHQLDQQFQAIYRQNIGECVVFKWVEAVREFLDEKSTSTVQSPCQSASPSADAALALNKDKCSDEDDGIEEDDEYGFDPQLHVYHQEDDAGAAVDARDDVPLPVIQHGEKLHDRKSIFQGHLAAVTHKQQVKMVLDSLKENRKIAAATHNIIAYRIDGGNGVWITGCNDDGEIHAGSRMLHLLDIMDARNVMVIVTRWYGGIHLGPDRFKHINNCTRDLLDVHGYIKDKGEKKGPKSTPPSQQGRKKKK